MPYKDALKNKECKRQWYLDNRDRVLKEAKISYQNNILKIKDRYEEIYTPSTALRLSKEKRDMELSKCLLIVID